MIRVLFMLVALMCTGSHLYSHYNVNQCIACHSSEANAAGNGFMAEIDACDDDQANPSAISDSSIESNPELPIPPNRFPVFTFPHSIWQPPKI